MDNVNDAWEFFFNILLRECDLVARSMILLLNVTTRRGLM